MGKRRQARKTKRQIELALAALGDSPEYVRYSLRSMGVTGERSDPDSCPVAQYLQFSFGNKGIAVSHYRVEYGNAWVRTPDAVASFIKKFDRGDFPELDRTGADRTIHVELEDVS